MATFRKRNGKWQVQIRRAGHPALSKSFILKSDADAWGRHMEARADMRMLFRYTHLKAENVADKLAKLTFPASV